MATPITLRQISAPSFKTGAGESLLKQSAADIASAGKLFQDEMARRAEAEFNAQKQAEAIRQFDLTHALNAANSKDNAAYNEARLKKMDAEIAAANTRNNIANLNYLLEKQKADSIKKFRDMFFNPTTAQPTGAAPTDPTQQGIPGMSDVTVTGVTPANSTMNGNIIPPGTSGVPAVNGIMAPAAAQTPAITSQYLFGDQLTNPTAQYYGQAGLAGLTSAESKQIDAQIFNPLATQGQQVINSRFTDLSDPVQFKEALGYINRITENPAFTNKALARDLQTQLKDYVNTRQKEDQAYHTSIAASQESIQKAEDRKRRLDKEDREAAIKSLEQTAKYRNYEADTNKLLANKFGTDMDAEAPKDLYKAFDAVLSYINISDKDRYYFYNNLVRDITLNNDLTTDELEVPIKDAFGNPTTVEVEDLKSNYGKTGLQKILSKYLPAGALTTANAAIEKQGKVEQELVDFMDELSALRNE